MLDLKALREDPDAFRAGLARRGAAGAGGMLLELGESLHAIDIERAARTSGSRFVYLTGPAVWLQFALVRYALDALDRHGFTPMIPPVLVREEAMYGTGFLPTDEAQIYVTRDDGLYLVGTSEVSLASFHQGEILE